MDNKLKDYRVDFCNSVYKILPEDERANTIINLYDKTFSVVKKLSRENFGLKTTIINLRKSLNTYYDYISRG